MIRQAAFVNAGKMLKGGLHCHTTRSDGAGTPEEVIRLHKANGYDFLALTDHRFYNYQNFAPETGITIIPGMEYDGLFYEGDGFRCFHSVCIGPSREDGNGYEQDERLERAKVTCQEDYQPYLDRIHAKKNLTIYCHPEWSSTPARYFEKLKGNFAMEVWNSGCVQSNGMDSDAAYWDELLGQGIHIYGVATDDGHAMKNHCCGWVRVKAENNINAIMKALENGEFYASTGPEIHDFWVDGDTVHIDCSNVSCIRFFSDCHPSKMIKSDKDDLTSGEIKINHGWEGGYRYIRATVYAADGSRAWTNPIWLD